MNIGYEFERRFVEIVARRLEENDITPADFSRVIFGADQSKPDNKWQRLIKRDSRTNKYQRLILEDAINMILFFQYDIEDFMYKVSKSLKDDPPKKSPEAIGKNGAISL